MNRILESQVVDYAPESHSGVVVIVTYLFCGLAIAGFIHFVIKRLPKYIRPPYGVTLFGVGVMLSYMNRTSELGGILGTLSDGIEAAENCNPDILFFVLLPPILYESGSKLNWHVFRRLKWSAIVLAIPGVILNILFIGLFAYCAFGSSWTWPLSFLIASILSTTDPVAVVSALHNLHAPDKLAILMDGESLLNDGTAIVGVLLFQRIIEGTLGTFTSVLDLFLRCGLGSVCLGIIFSFVQLWFLRSVRTYDHSWVVLETTIVTVGIFLCYTFADLSGCSGIISVVTLAVSSVVFGRGVCSPESERQIANMVSQLSYLSNQLIWLIGGHITANQLFHNTVAGVPGNWFRLIGLFCMLNIARGLSVWILSPTLRRMGYGLNRKETIMLIHCGLRGVVSIALAMMMKRSGSIDDRTKGELGFFVSGTVMLTLLINGNTVELLYRYLKIYPKRTWAQIQTQRSVALVDQREHHLVASMKSHWFFGSDIDYRALVGLIPDFSRAEYNAETGKLHIPSDPVRVVLDGIVSTNFDNNGYVEEEKKNSNSSNAFMYSSVGSLVPLSSPSTAAPSSSSSSVELVGSTNRDKLENVVQLGDSRLKSVSAQIFSTRSIYTSARSMEEFATAKAVADSSPLGDYRITTSRESAEFSVFFPAIGIPVSMLETTPEIIIGLSSEDAIILCGIDCVKRELITGQKVTPLSPKEFRRDLVRGDTVTIRVDSNTEGSTVTYSCGKYILGSSSIDPTLTLSALFPTILFKQPDEQVELSFPIQSTTVEESRTESSTYILNAAICLYEDLYRAGSIESGHLHTLTDSVQYGIDAANYDLEVNSMKERMKRIREIYTNDRISGSYESVGETPSRFSPLETEWGFLKLRQSSRSGGFVGWIAKVGNFLGFQTQYRATYRLVEELLAFAVVHADLVAHAETTRHPETAELVGRLVNTAKNQLAITRIESPREFFIAKHVIAANILLHIRLRVLREFVSEGALSQASVDELFEDYFAKQLVDLKTYTPKRAEGSSIWSRDTIPLVPIRVV